MKKKLKYDKSIFHNNKQIIYRIFFFKEWNMWMKIVNKNIFICKNEV